MERIKEHNQQVIHTAEYRAREMRLWPSPLEDRMKDFLERHRLHYECQRIFYIYGDNDYILRYFIADFFLPEYNLIIEVDGKFHNKHKQADRDRTKLIQEHYPNIEVMRFTWKDLSDGGKMKRLLNRVHCTL